MTDGSYIPDGYCLNCDHRIALDGPTRCPECGGAIDPTDRRHRSPRRTRRLDAAGSVIRRVVLCMLILAIPFVVLFVIFGVQIGFYPNIGIEGGYYGTYNRIRHVIDDMPGVRVVDTWQHRDITLEDFGFTVQTDDGRQLRIDFWDHEPHKDERDASRTRAYVQRQIDEARGSDASDD